MNWRIESKASELRSAEAEVAHAEGEDDQAEPSPALVKAARSSAATLARELGGDTLVTIEGHETLTGRGFKPGHASITVSRVDPKS